MVIFDLQCAINWVACVIATLATSTFSPFLFWLFSAYLMVLSISFPPIYWEETDETT